MAVSNGAPAIPLQTLATSNNTASGSFVGLRKELSALLQLHTVPGYTPNPSAANFLIATDPGRAYLPGQPRIRLPTGAPTTADPVSTQTELLEYLGKCHLTEPLDGILPYMKYIFVQTPSHRHIMPLHHQCAHGREILVNEHPGLHLVWYYERIFIKPIPAYFYVQAFWDFVAQSSSPDIHRAAVGFMRSYYWLIQYEIDFLKACKINLIPKKPDGQHPSYDEFCDFIAPFKHVSDAHVGRRFHYGELRLTRLNKAAMLFGGHLAYFHIYPQWGSYLSHLLAPIITVFVVLSVVLNSMQVTLQAVDGPDGADGRWKSFVTVAAWFPVAVVCLIATVIGTGLVGIMVMGVKDLIWSVSVRRQKEKGQVDAGEKSHGMLW